MQYIFEHNPKECKLSGGMWFLWLFYFFQLLIIWTVFKYSFYILLSSILNIVLSNWCFSVHQRQPSFIILNYYIKIIFSSDANYIFLRLLSFPWSNIIGNSNLSHTVLFSKQLIMSCAFLFLRLTGFHLPPPVTSTKSVFSLRLTSDFAVSAHGFKVYYEGKTFLTK